MELKEFVKKVIIELDQAVTEANMETKRKIKFKGIKEQKNAVEFDIAVTAESVGASGVGGGIKVWGIAQAGATASKEEHNSVVSRVSFSVDISEMTIEEEAQQNAEIRNQFHTNRSHNDAI